MDALTAGIAATTIQLCLSLIMASTYFTIPEEKCTRFWAQAAALLGLGVLAFFIKEGDSTYVLPMVGNNFVVAGLVCQWWGLQAFHRTKPSKWGWAIIAFYFVAYALLRVNGDYFARSVLATGTAMLIYGLDLHALWRHRGSRVSFAGGVAVAGLILSIASLGYRAFESIERHPDFTMTTSSVTGVTVIYLVPMAGTLLFSVALLLLYFERLVKKKHYLATHDDLTRLLNRRAIIAGGEQEIDIAARSRRALAVAYIDVDYFKQINDRLGHENGDAVLAELARVLKDECRNTELVGRYGGEEFCIVLPNADRHGAEIVGARLVDAVRKHQFSTGLAVTISVGLAVLPADGRRRKWSDLMNQADIALYRAKKSGRDRFCLGEASEADAGVPGRRAS